MVLVFAHIAVVRAKIAYRLSGSLNIYEPPAPETSWTCISAIDRQLNGIPQNGLTQLCIPEGISSGKSTMLLSLMAQFTRREYSCALIDASDCFDPASAEAAGMDLSHVLWVRCGAKHRLKPLEQAFKAADILVQNGGFGLIAVDLSNIEERLIRKIPLTTWFRFARVVEKMPTALVFLTTFPAAGSCASLTLHMAGVEPCWTGPASFSHARLLAEMECEIEVGRSRLRKPVQSVRPKFTAAPVWA